MLIVFVDSGDDVDADESSFSANVRDADILIAESLDEAYSVDTVDALVAVKMEKQVLVLKLCLVHRLLIRRGSPFGTLSDDF